MAEPVKLRQVFDDLGEFVELYRAKISKEGMRVKTGNRYRVGTRVEVELRLADDLALVKASGEVAGQAADDDGVVLVRFTSLDEQSGELLERLMRRVASEGGTPFSLKDQLAGGELRPTSDPVRTRDLQEAVAAALGNDQSSRPSVPVIPSEPTPASDLRGPSELDPDSAEPAQGRGITLGRAAVVAALVVIIGAALCVAVFLMRRQAQQQPGAGDIVEVDGAATESATAEAAAVVTPQADPVDTASTDAVDDRTQTALPEPTQRPQPTPRPPPTAVPTSRRAALSASRVDEISWRDEGGATIITIVTDGDIDASRVHSFGLDGPPRWAIQIRDIREPFVSLTLEVGDSRVERIRTWHHSQRNPPELHIVIDLKPAAARAAVVIEGETITVTVPSG